MRPARECPLWVMGCRSEHVCDRSAHPHTADLADPAEVLRVCATSRHWEKHPSLSWSELNLGVGKHRSRHNRRLTNRCPRAGIQSPRQATTLTIDLGVQVCGAFRRYSVTVVAFLVGLVFRRGSVVTPIRGS